MTFLHMAGLGKQVKNAYSADRLKLGAFEEQSVIATPHCIIAVEEEQEPNKMKAIITEYAGFMPVHDPTTRHQGFIEIGKNQEQRDLDAAETKSIQDLLNPGYTLEPYVITPVTITANGIPVRVIQHTKTLTCRGIKQEFLDLITYKDLDYDVEGEPIGPEVNEVGGLAYFTNATTRLVISLFTFSSDLTKEIINTLQLLDLREKKL